MSRIPIVRPATPADEEFIVGCNCNLVRETEHREIDREVVTLGVRAGLADDRKARYFIATVDGIPAGQVMFTWEWSDWRNGNYVWLQSVYVLPEYRGSGVFRALFEHVRDLASREPNVAGLRLYVENDNANAQGVYQKLGFKDASYKVFEIL